MNARSAVDRLLRTDPLDTGCGEAWDQLDGYVELLVAGAAVDVRYPVVAAHLRHCVACREVFEGLLAAVTADDADPGH